MVKRRIGFVVVTATFAALAIVACRSVLGIEDIDPVSATDGATTDATTLADAAHVDAAVDSGKPPFVSACQGSSECPKCCRETYGEGIGQLEDFSRDGGCLCGAKCTSECAATRCATPPDLVNKPNMGCGECYDHAMVDRQPPGIRACADARDRCEKASTECDEAVKCLEGCFGATF